MRKILAFVLIQISTINYKTIGQIVNLERIDMKTFKSKELALNQVYIDEVYDSIIEYGVFGDVFVKNAVLKGNPYQTKKTYFKSNNQIKAESNYFYKIPIGISRKYDNKGNVIQEIDWEKLNKRSFSIEDLISKMKKEFEVDLLDSKNKGLSIDSTPFAYVVNIFSDNSSVIREIKIDALTGDVLSEVLIQPKK